MDHSFCEEHLLGLPEYYNSLSSLFIVYFGLCGLMNAHNDIFIDILYANLAIVGIGSTGYHWYGNIGWALFDEIPIIVTVFSGIVYADNVYFLTYNNKFIKEDSDNNLSLTHKTPVRNMSMVYNKKYRLLTYLFGMYMFIINNVMANFRLIFPQLFTCIVVYLYYKIYCLINLLDSYNRAQTIYKAYNSLITIAVSGAIWAGTEISCKHVNNHALLIGHPMWHFFIGHGFYNLIQVVYFIKLCDANIKMKYDSIYLLQIYSDTDKIDL